MKKRFKRRPVLPKPTADRAGGMLIMSTVALFVILGFAALAVDIGFICLTKSRLQSAADAATLSGGIELYDGWGLGAVATANEVELASRAAAVQIAAAHSAGEIASVYADPDRDVALGRRVWDAEANEWTETYGTAPFNLIKVTLIRGTQESANGDRPLPLFFGNVLGKDSANLTVISKVAFSTGVGFQTWTDQTANILPFAFDEPSWNDLLAGEGQDNYTFDPQTGEVTAGPDGIKEIDFFPYGTHELPPGNRGTLNFSGGGANALKRQIEFGLNEQDLAPYGGKLSLANGPLQLSGKPGMNTSIKSALETIIGKPRGIAIFNNVEGPGANATYTIVKFAGIRILDLKLTGNPNSRYVTAQPAVFVDQTVITSTLPLQQDSILGPLSLVP